LPDGVTEGEDVECGYLVVPENRANAEERTIRLAIGIFHPSGGAAHPDPVVYLSGGPGGSALKLLWLAAEGFAPILEAKRDLIIFDQRGVGYSQPALDCPTMQERFADLLDSEWEGKPLNVSELRALKVEALSDCAVTLREIADLTQYNTAENAADVADLRLALGYEEINLWGASYGTRLALEVMRLYPDGIRSVILDAPYTPEADLYLELPGNFARALDGLFADCAADAGCNTAYPDLRKVFYKVLEQLGETPAETNVLHPLNRTRYPLLIDADMFVGLMFRGLYITELRPLLPQVIYKARDGKFDMILLVAQRELLLQDVRSWGMYLSVLCHDEIAFSSVEQFHAALAEYPEFAGFFGSFEAGDLTYDVCAVWGAGAADASANEPVASDIPTLIFSGEYDPIISPEWGAGAAAALTNGYFYEFRGFGHGVGMLNDCPRSMMLTFLDDPLHAPDDACTAEMETLAFVLPTAEATVIELEPFTSEVMGITGVVPVGWTEVGPGAYARQSSIADGTALIQQRVPLSVDELLERIAMQLGLGEVPASTGEREVNDLTWTLYRVEVQGIAIDIGLTEVEDTTIVIMLNSALDERDMLYDQVFLPAVDTLVPTNT
jgi:pimeloyl-ACP methyl ester carboxylesterase